MNCPVCDAPLKDAAIHVGCGSCDAMFVVSDPRYIADGTLKFTVEETPTATEIRMETIQ